MAIFLMIIALTINAPAGVAEDIMAVYTPAMEQLEATTGYVAHGAIKIFVGADHAYTSFQYTRILGAVIRVEIHLPNDWKP